MIRMTSSERFIAALQNKPVDRVPVVPKIWVDFAANVTETDIRDIIQNPLVALRTIASAGKKLGFDAVRQFYFPEKIIVEEANGDVFETDRSGRKIGKIDMQGGLSTHLFDSKDYRIDDPVTIAYGTSWTPPEPVVNTLEDAQAMAVPDAQVFDSLGWGKMQKMVLDEFEDDLSLIGDCGSATMSFYVSFRGINNAMMDLITEPELVHAMMQKGAEIAIAKGKYWLDNGIRVLRLNDSTGNMSLMSPSHWKEFVYPYMKTVCDELHRHNSQALIYCHICGSILPVMDLLVETGLDCIGPLDPLGGFTVAQAREAAGNKICLMGGVNTLDLLQKTPDEIRKEAAICIAGAGKDGGYVLGSGCVVPPHSPVENLLALVLASKEHRILTEKRGFDEK